MANRRIVGWMDDSEWEAVYYNIFYGKRNQVRAALDVISVWRARFAGRIPVAIEATSQLLETQLLDGDENSLVKRQCMSAAVSQFIGLLTERSLKGHLYASPMHRRGEGLGIPEWVTSLRHDAAHGFMPSYHMLDRAVNFAIEWLRVNHWEEHLWKQREKADEELKTSSPTEKNLVETLRQCLLSGKKSSFQALKSFLVRFPNSVDVLCAVLVDYNIIPMQQSDVSNSKFYVGGKEGRLSLSQWAKSCFERIFSCFGKQEIGIVLVKFCGELRYPTTSVEICILWVDFLLDISSECLFSDVVHAEIVSKLIEAKSHNHIVQKALDRAKFLGNVKYDPNYSDELLHRLHSSLPSPKSNYVSWDSESTETKASWTLCDVGTDGRSSLGLLPGQDKQTLWKEFCGNGLAPAEGIIKNWNSDNGESTVGQKQQQVFTEQQIMEFCESIDLL